MEVAAESAAMVTLPELVKVRVVPLMVALPAVME